MRNSHNARNVRRLFILCVALCACAALPLLSSARTSNSSSTNIVNNSSRQIIHVYLSHVNTDDWSGDQLGGASISPGQSFTLSNYSCDQQQVKIIGEDQEGCFVSTVVDCGTDATWTITNATAADCGGQ